MYYIPCQVLKLYAWEPSFQDKISEIRTKETNILKKNALYSAFSSFSFTTAPFLVKGKKTRYICEYCRQFCKRWYILPLLTLNDFFLSFRWRLWPFWPTCLPRTQVTSVPRKPSPPWLCSTFYGFPSTCCQWWSHMLYRWKLQGLWG